MVHSIIKKLALRRSQRVKSQLEEVYSTLPCSAYKLNTAQAIEYLNKIHLILYNSKPHYFFDRQHTTENGSFFFRYTHVADAAIREDIPYVLHELGDLIHFHDILQANVYFCIMDVLERVRTIPAKGDSGQI